jgi:hypothetical protein
MPVRKNSTFKTFYFECVTIALVFFVVVYLCRVLPNREAPETEVLPEPPQVEPIPEPEPELHFKIRTYDDGKILNYRSEDYYRYGPSIMEYEDGSMDMWVSSPGNSGSQWDWIRYRHSDDGINWSSEQIVLKPTPGSKDQCSVCDPGAIYFNGYYYLGYTSTDSYAGKGFNNMAFVARSQYPDGPFEKWNGSGWGGDPEPIIAYEDDPKGWGIGELSFVIYKEDLYIFYTYADLTGAYIELCKADLVDDWPLTIRYKDRVLVRENQDSMDAVFDEAQGKFLGFSIDMKMSEGSRLIMYASDQGKGFTDVDTEKDNIDDYAHSIGIAKSPEGHINTDKTILIGYAYGQYWGRWNLKVMHIDIEATRE